MLNLFEQVKPFNISKWLAKNKGGKWKYDGKCCWWCDDGKRHVARVAMDCMDENSPAGYCLYSDKNSEWIYFG